MRSLEFGVRIDLIIESDLVMTEIITHLGKHWSIEHDSSILDDNGWIGVRLSSPPMVALDQLYEALGYLDSNMGVSWHENTCVTKMYLGGKSQLVIPLKTDWLFDTVRRIK